VEGKTVLFRKGPESKGLAFQAHVCHPAKVRNFQRKRPNLEAGATNYTWRALMLAPESNPGSKTPTWRYFTSLAELRRATEGKEARYLKGTKVLKIEWAKWCGHEEV